VEAIMRVCNPAILLVLTASVFSLPLDAATYYVSPSGSNGNNGLSTSTAFRTIGKAASVMTAGGRCLILQGIYRETVTPANSGTSGAPISFEAYGNELVYISGADTVTGWTQHSGSIYKAPMAWNLGEYKNQIIVDGKMAWMARSPNVDDAYTPNPYLMWCGGGFGVVDRRRWQTLAEPVAVSQRVCIGGPGGQGPGTTITATVEDDGDPAYRLPPQLFGRSDNFFKGGLLTLQNSYYLSTAPITSSQSTSTKTSLDCVLNAFAMGGGGPGWISHVFGLLDAPNEWYRDSAAQTLYLWAPGNGNPSTHLVEAKRRVLGFDLTGKSYVNIKGIRFIATSLTTKNASNCTIEECQFKYVAHGDMPSDKEMGVSFEIAQNAGDGHLGIYLGGSNNVIRKCMVKGSASSGIVIDGSYNTVTNCRITSCDYSVTYHAGILVINDLPDGGSWVDDNAPVGAQITNCYFAYNNRANVQVGRHANATSDPKVGIRINHNEFGTSCYTSETGQVSMQSCAGGDISYNRFHDVAFVDVGSTVLEEDFGARDWKIHHNVFYQGDSSVVNALGEPPVRRGFDFSFSYFGGEDSWCYNNTIVDLTEPNTHENWQYMTTDGTPNGPPWPESAVHNKNNLFALSDTMPWKFADPVHRNYALTALSTKAIDKGVAIPGKVDKYVGAAPDLGAFEYGETPWTAGPDWAEQPWVYPPGDPAALQRALRMPAGAGAPSVLLAHDAVLLRATEGVGYQARLYTMQGALVFSAKRPNGGSCAISTHGLARGTYALKIDCSNYGIVRKLAVGPMRQ
jgi:parallel beta-helix repeat protein